MRSTKIKKREGRNSTFAQHSALEKKLKAYVLAASAAGVGALAFTQPAWAEIVYTNVNTPVILNGGPLMLDLNNDGIADFKLTNFSYLTEGIGTFFLAIAPAQSGNGVLPITSNQKIVAAALSSGHDIGAKNSFLKNNAQLYMARNKFNTARGSYYGQWLSVEYAYLGLKFVINGQPHYGWAQVKFGSTGGFLSASLSGYAYETIANHPIKAGEKSGTDNESTAGTAIVGGEAPRVPTLGTLAAGACCLSYWRSDPAQKAGNLSAGAPEREQR
jgi:hypothetical protein